MFEITIGQNPEPHSERPFIETLVGGQIVYADSNDAVIESMVSLSVALYWCRG